MPSRRPVVAGMFYPAGRASCLREVKACLASAGDSNLEGPAMAGIVPHAGWAFSGAIAASVFRALAASGVPDTIIVFGAVHSWGVTLPSVYGHGSWMTPLGAIDVDEELAAEMIDAAGGQLVDSPEAHASEHSIEVQLPFLKHLFPEARIVPIATPPSPASASVGLAAATAVRNTGRKAYALGSTDLTHYGPRYGFAPVGVGDGVVDWTKANDDRLLELVSQMRDREILSEAEQHHNCCGAGAVVAAIAFARAQGATRGIILAHLTSHEVMAMGPASDMVGYGAVAFV